MILKNTCHCGDPTCPRCQTQAAFYAEQQRRRAETMGPCKCGTVRDDPDKKMCAKCRERSRTAKQRMRAKRAAAGKCIDCGKPVEGGKARCRRCYSKVRLHCKNRYERRFAAHICVWCGKAPACFGRTLCMKCWNRSLVLNGQAMIRRGYPHNEYR